MACLHAMLRKAERLDGECTFADALHCAHLRAILHGVQGEVNLRKRLLLLDCANSIVQVLRLVDILRVVLHGGRSMQAAGSCGRARLLVEGGSAVSADQRGASVAAGGETCAEARFGREQC